MAKYGPVAGDIVMGIIGLSNISKCESWPILRIYDAFFAIKDSNVELKKELYFTIKGGQRYSRKLEEIFFQLGTTKLLEIRNPEYNYVLISPDSKKRIKEYLKNNINKESYESILNLSKKFRKEIASSMTRNEINACKV